MVRTAVKTSLGGWPILSDRPQFGFTAPDGGRVRVATEEVAQSMHYLLHQLRRRVQGEVRATSSWRRPGFDPGGVGGRSNHHAGTAVDQNGDQHPFEADAPPGTWKLTYTRAQVRTIREILAELINDAGQPVIRWGLDFKVGRRDPMHFEIARADGVDSLFVANREVAQANRRVLRTVAGVQSAVHIRVDQKWGTNTQNRVRAVRARARGLSLDPGVSIRFVQLSVGAPTTGTWDAVSQDKLVETVKALQRAWRVDDDGSWGDLTEAAFKLNQTRFLHYKPILVP
jgi:hypothetical protein